jgi:hypothetical protein
MSKYTLRECTLTFLDDTFGLHQDFSSTYLDTWLQTEVAIVDYERETLEHLQHLLTLNTPGWNEQELSMHFIGPMLSLVFFSERKIIAIVPGVEGEVELSGEPDGMIATGYREPKIPLFAFTEYKKKLDPLGDPAGQTLAAMVVAQVLNEHKRPLYGAYVIGTSWHFMVLEESRYVLSREYSALSNEIFDILRILKALKSIILDITANRTIGKQ